MTRQSTEFSARDEFFALTRLALPVVATNFVNFGAGITDTAFIGHIPCTRADCSLKANALTAVGLTNAWLTLTYFLAKGLLNGFDTLVSQAYGAKMYEKCGELFQTGGLCCFLVAILVGILWWFTGQVLDYAFVIDADALDLVHQFARVIVLGLPGMLAYDWQAQYMANMRIVNPALYVGAMSLMLNAALNYLFIFSLNWGFIGSPYATVVTRTALPIGLWIALKYQGHWTETWYGVQKSAFQWPQISEFLKLALPAMGLVLTEMVCFEAITALVALLKDNIVTSAHVIVNQLLFAAFFIPMGYAVATATRVGMLVGGANPRKARLAARVAQTTGITIGCFMSVLLYFGRFMLSSIFTDDPVIRDTAASIIPLLSLLHVGDATQGVTIAIMRATGRQQRGLVINLVGYYVAALPLGALFAFYFNLGVYGVWGGIAIGVWIIAIAAIIHNEIVLDFDEEVVRASTRLDLDDDSDSAVEDEALLADDEVGIPRRVASPQLLR